MPVALGSSSIEKMYLGTTEVKKAYLGENLVFEVSAGGSLVMFGNPVGQQTAAPNVSYILDPTTGAAINSFGTLSMLDTVGGAAFHSNKLYAVGWDLITGRFPQAVQQALYTINTTTGVATRIGSASEFGVREVQPAGLASHNGVLYMVGLSADALYTLNAATGVATRIGSANRFGVNETRPTGLASHNGVLYMVGLDTDALYTINTTTGVATQIGSANRFEVNEPAPTGLASHNGVLYMIGLSTRALYTLDATTGVAMRIGSADRFGVDAVPVNIVNVPSSVSFPAPIAPSAPVVTAIQNQGGGEYFIRWTHDSQWGSVETGRFSVQALNSAGNPIGDVQYAPSTSRRVTVRGVGAPARARVCALGTPIVCATGP